MVEEIHQPDAVFNRLKQVPFVVVESDSGGNLGIRATQALSLSQIEAIARVYGTEPTFRSVHVSPTQGNFQHPELALDLRLFRLYYLESARELGEQQLALYSRVLTELRRDYALPSRRQDFLTRVRSLLGNYRSIVELHGRLLSFSAPRTPQQREQARLNAGLANSLLATTGIQPPPPGTMQGAGGLGRPRGVRGPGTGSSQPSYDEVQRRHDDYISLKQNICELHPIFVFLHQNRASHRALASLALAGTGRVHDHDVLALLDQGIADIQGATSAFQRSLEQRSWSDIRPLLDMAKASMFGAEDSMSYRLYALARQIDAGVARGDADAALMTALLVVGVVLAVATGGLAAPYVLLLDLALATTAEVVAVRQYLRAERANLQRASIARLELIRGGTRIASEQEDLDGRLWMMLFAAALAPALVAGGAAVSVGVRVLRRATPAAEELIARSGARMLSGTVSSRSRPPARSVSRPGTGRPTTRDRAVQRAPQPPRRGTEPPPPAEAGARPAQPGRSLRGVDEAALLAGQVIAQHGDVTFRLVPNSAGVVRLFRCAS
ncbi:MAG: hypothetical protein ABWY12_00115 [Burkholderiales bacterium]